MVFPFPKLPNSPLIMGILNVTPDSFSDGGKFNTVNKAVARAKEMEEQGADIIDIGGESSGPGSVNVRLEEELDRVIPVIKEIRRNSDIVISVDTYKAEVAHQSLEAGANMINDVTSFRGDEALPYVIAKYQCPVVLMHAKDSSARTTINEKEYDDVIESVKEFLAERIAFAKSKGMEEEQIIIDPGLGHFISSDPKYSFEIIERLGELKEVSPNILIGISRKSFLGGTLESRDTKGNQLSKTAYNNGATIIRTHDVRGIVQIYKK